MINRFKIMALTSVFAIMALFVPSCTEKPAGGGTDKPLEVENAFLWGDGLYQIRSVVYTEEEIDGYTVFYFSPTRGITDVDGMQEAGDFLKICVDDATGENPVDFTKENNSVSYKDVTVNKDNISSLKSSEFEISLLDSKYMSLSFAFIMEDGNVFRAHYYGDCMRWPHDQSLEWDYVVEASTVEAVYNGEIEQNNVSYYQLLMATSTFRLENDEFEFDNDGYILIGDFYAEPSAEGSTSFPTGTFRMSKYGEAGSYEGAIAWFEAGDPLPKSNPELENDIVISKEVNEAGQTIYTVEITFVDEEGVLRKMGYEGPIQIMSQSAQLPAIEEDKTDFEGYSANAIYMGNLFEKNTGLMTINLFDEIYDKEDEFGGFSASLAIFSQLFNGENEPTLIPGTYKIPGQQVGDKNSGLIGMPVNMIGTIFPFGTYMHHNTDAGWGRFGFATSGTVEIKENGIADDGKTVYLITFDFMTPEGKRMAGSYEGPVEVSDQSDDENKDDGTSTLENDYEMGLDRIPVAHLIPYGQLKYPLGDDYSSWPAEPILVDAGHQCIKIGTYSDYDYVLADGGTGDFFSLGLVTRLGEDHKLAPGKYPVVLENWPDYFKPGVTIRGQFVQFGEIVDMQYTVWRHFMTERDDKEFVMDGHACIYEGFAEVIRDPKDEAGVFTIRLDGYCVRKYNVTGTWKGKIVGPDGQPVEAAEPFNDTAAASSYAPLWHTRYDAETMKEAAARFIPYPYIPARETLMR